MKKLFSKSTFKLPKWLHWFLRLISAAILLQTLFFKFSGAPESVYIFTQLGIEPWGRILSGVVEAIASLLLLSSAYCRMGALLSLGTMTGAIFSHLATLGIEVRGDGGLLFSLAVTVWVSSLLILLENRKS
ncbi:MAG: DoxX family membrane protein [Bdellovibrionota bacterium]